MKKANKIIGAILSAVLLFGTLPTAAEKMEMDASVIAPEYAAAVKAIYHMELMPNIYRDYNRPVTGQTLFPLLVKLMNLTETANNYKNQPGLAGCAQGSDLNGCLYALQEAGYSLMDPDTVMSQRTIRYYIALALFDYQD